MNKYDPLDKYRTVRTVHLIPNDTPFFVTLTPRERKAATASELGQFYRSNQRVRREFREALRAACAKS